MKNIANADFTEVLTPPTGWSISAYTRVDVGIPSLKNRADGSGIIKDGFAVQITTLAAANATTGVTFAQSTPAIFGINASSLKNRADGDPVILEGDDSGIVEVPGTLTPPGTAGILPVNLAVDNAGQDKVRGV